MYGTQLASRCIGIGFSLPLESSGKFIALISMRSKPRDRSSVWIALVFLCHPKSNTDSYRDQWRKRLYGESSNDNNKDIERYFRSSQSVRLLQISWIRKELGGAGAAAHNVSVLAWTPTGTGCPLLVCMLRVISLAPFALPYFPLSLTKIICLKFLYKVRFLFGPQAPRSL